MKKATQPKSKTPRQGGKGKSKKTKPETQIPAPAAPPAVEALVEEAKEEAKVEEATQPERAKPRKGKSAKAKEASGKLSCLDAAAAVLKDKGEPMRCKDMITAMAEQDLWHSNAPTPHATLYSAILREITTKGEASRFKKTDRGHFALNA